MPLTNMFPRWGRVSGGCPPPSPWSLDLWMQPHQPIVSPRASWSPPTGCWVGGGSWCQMRGSVPSPAWLLADLGPWALCTLTSNQCHTLVMGRNSGDPCKPLAQRLSITGPGGLRAGSELSAASLGKEDRESTSACRGFWRALSDGVLGT